MRRLFILLNSPAHNMATNCEVTAWKRDLFALKIIKTSIDSPMRETCEKCILQHDSRNHTFLIVAVRSARFRRKRQEQLLNIYFRPSDSFAGESRSRFSLGRSAWQWRAADPRSVVMRPSAGPHVGMHLSEKFVGATSTFNECNGFTRLNATV